MLWGKERGRASRLEGRLGKLACRRIKRICTLEKAGEGTPGRRTSEGKGREVGSVSNPDLGHGGWHDRCLVRWCLKSWLETCSLLGDGGAPCTDSTPVFPPPQDRSLTGKLEPVSPPSPPHADPELELVPPRLSKEELIQNMDRVDREITMVEQQISKLKKKQVRVGGGMPVSAPDSAAAAAETITTLVVIAVVNVC